MNGPATAGAVNLTKFFDQQPGVSNLYQEVRPGRRSGFLAKRAAGAPLAQK
jgi:hypothetical protein